MVKMKLYLLERIESVGWDEYEAKIIRAKNPDHARLIANKRVGDEGKIWRNINQVSCKRLIENGPEEVILTDFHAG